METQRARPSINLTPERLEIANTVVGLFLNPETNRIPVERVKECYNALAQAVGLSPATVPQLVPSDVKPTKLETIRYAQSFSRTRGGRRRPVEEIETPPVVEDVRLDAVSQEVLAEIKMDSIHELAQAVSTVPALLPLFAEVRAAVRSVTDELAALVGIVKDEVQRREDAYRKWMAHMEEHHQLVPRAELEEAQEESQLLTEENERLTGLLGNVKALLSESADSVPREL